MEKSIYWGLKTYGENPAVALPYVFSYVIQAAVFAVLAAVVYAVYAFYGLGAGVLAFVLALLVFFILSFWVGSYFLVSGILVAEKAAGGGRISVGDCFRVGWGGLFKFVMANAVASVVGVAVFLFLGVLQWLFKIDFVLPAVFLWGAALMFYPYFAVLTDEDWLGCLKKGFLMAYGNKFAAFALFVFTYYGGLFSVNIILPVFFMGSSILAFIAFVGGVTPSNITNPLIYVLAALWGVFTVFAFVVLPVAVVSPLKTLWELRMYKKFWGKRK